MNKTTSPITKSAGSAAAILPGPPRKPSTEVRPNSRVRNAPRSTTPADFTSERATAALVRRVLCAHVTPAHGSEQRERGTPRPLEELLPPLTSSNEVDLQLYALIAIIMKEFVYSWYSKITPDHGFTEEIIQVIAHCTRSLEQRLRQVDVTSLLLDEIPSLIEAHVIAYRVADQSAVATQSQSQLRTAYHALNPHLSLSPVPDALDPALAEQQQLNESIYCQMLAQGILAVLLPTEDLENVCLRTLVGDILADLLIGEIVGSKVAQSWFLWEIIRKVAREMNPDASQDAGMEPTKKKSRLESFGLLSSQTDTPDGYPAPKYKSSVSDIFWKLLHYVYLGYLVIRFVLLEFVQVASRSSFTPARGPVSKKTSRNRTGDAESRPSRDAARRPFIQYRIFNLAAQLFDVPRRMPWLGGSFSLVQHLLLEGPGRFGKTDGYIDSFLCQTIPKHLFTPSLLPYLLLAVRTTVFPSNTRPPSSGVVDIRGLGASQDGTVSVPLGASTPSRNAPQLEQLQSDQGLLENAKLNSVKRACARSLRQLIPRRIGLAIFGIPSSEHLDDATGLSAEGSHHPASLDMTIPACAATAPLPPIGVGFNPYTPFSGATAETGPSSNSDSQPGYSIPHPTTAPSLNAGLTMNLKSNLSSLRERQDEELLCAIERDVLDLFSDSYCNKHLVYSIVEAVVIKLIPELTEHTVGELMAERGLQEWAGQSMGQNP
ncbi:hypothetical protein LOZ65_006637 [Ophidiomyces ophidiicola]|nr:hypothetical protein LOZ65_006637 [Ophidiomyces ophidiicola]